MSTFVVVAIMTFLAFAAWAVYLAQRACRTPRDAWPREWWYFLGGLGLGVWLTLPEGC